MQNFPRNTKIDVLNSYLLSKKRYELFYMKKLKLVWLRWDSNRVCLTYVYQAITGEYELKSVSINIKLVYIFYITIKLMESCQNVFKHISYWNDIYFACILCQLLTTWNCLFVPRSNLWKLYTTFTSIKIDQVKHVVKNM